jgi:hypothetical protein
MGTEQHLRDSADGRDVDWDGWHAAYEQADSPLAQRLALVQQQVSAALDRAPAGQIRAISVCAGQGHDLIGVLARHPRRDDVSARLVELDEHNVARARRAAEQAALERIEIVQADASRTDPYDGAVPADLVLVCGVLGNISSADVLNTIEKISMLCAPGATLIWTRHRNPPDLVPTIRATLARAGFEPLAFTEAPNFGVGADRLTAEPAPFHSGVRLFEFIGHDALWPHLDPARRRALGALFRPDCSLEELIAAVRALPFGGGPEQTVEQMLREARGTSLNKHTFLAQVLAQRFPSTEPRLLHRLYRLQPAQASERFGQAIAETVPPGGVDEVHTYMTIELPEGRIALDVCSHHEKAWDGRSALEPVCGPGEDVPAGEDPRSSLHMLERQRCDVSERASFLHAMARAGQPDGAPETAPDESA